jgi:phosphatidylethanolamine/phosphatidyl-N-methylethanolamine N-methyltransferase
MAASMNTHEPQEHSVAVVEGVLMERVYGKMSAIYDIAFGPALQPGRRRAVAAMGDTAGRKVLEVGVGTGINLSLYRPGTEVSGIDFSEDMLERAEERAAREGLAPRLFQMDAADLRFPDASFDVVYAPYVISVVPDPVVVLREMQRVCRPGGCVVVLNHFRSAHPLLSHVERWVSPFTVRIGFKADVDMATLFASAGVRPDWVEKVNRPKMWTLAYCTRPALAQER